MNEHELSEGLRSTAAGVSAHADLAEVELGAGRVRSRRRVATGVVAAMLVAGAGGTGFGIGRSISDDGDTIAAPAAASETDTTEVADVANAADSSDGDTADAAEPAGTEALDRALALSDEAAVRERAAAEAAGGYYEGGDFDRSYFEPASMELVYERTLDNGVRVRMQRGQTWDQGAEMWPEGQWQPAPFCWGSAEMRITVDGSDVVDISGGAFYDELFRGLHFEVTGLGWADDHEMRIVTVQSDPGPTAATVRWADGPADTTPIVDGLAVLVVDGSQPWDVAYTVELADADGTRTFTQDDLNYYDEPEWRAACNEPPPALPEAGEQPADPEAARVAIADNFALLWNRDVPQAEKLDLLDDWTGVQAAIDSIDEGDFAETAETAVHSIDELVFTSPTEVWFRYSIDTDLTFFGDRYGTVALVDGAWQFPGAFICQDLGLAGAGCEPWVDNIFPPSWYERYGGPFEGDHEIVCYETEDGSEVCEGSAYLLEDVPAVTIGP